MNTITNHIGAVEIRIDAVNLKGQLRLVEHTKGIVLFSHGSGSSRLSTRNNYVADVLSERGFSSLLFDLLTEEEDQIYKNRFDIALLTERLLKVTQWISEYEMTKHLSIGYFGASTGAASALSAAAEIGANIKAVVSRGGRPDLSMPLLHKIESPTLLLVGSDDRMVIELNKKAQSQILGICELKIIEGASHLFEEPGKLKKVAMRAGEWFEKYLSK